MSKIGATLPEAYVTGSGEALFHSNDGSYFIKPVFGCSAKGCYPIEKKGQNIFLKDRGLSVPEFVHWYKEEHGTSHVVVEEKLQDYFFDSIMDYKVHCFYGFGVDHILCMQRDGGVKARFLGLMESSQKLPKHIKRVRWKHPLLLIQSKKWHVSQEMFIVVFLFLFVAWIFILLLEELF